jgi:DNA (cytosine-5)-methyltransferase 1
VAAYYNEFDPNAAAWLRELIKQGLIADGIVDERSIIDVQANDLNGFTQCHFFGGIGGWSRALRLANWQDDKPVWTASLPCQPFSTAGKQQGKADERHLLPHFLELVKQCRPDTLFGEQVEGAIRHGWLDYLQAAMEAENYAVGHVILGAHSVQSFHQRQRLYWVANSNNPRPQRRLSGWQDSQRQVINGLVGCDSAIDGVANSKSQRDMREPEKLNGASKGQRGVDLHNGISASGLFNRLGNAEHNGHVTQPQPESHVQTGEKRWENGQDVSSESTGTSQSNHATSLSGRANGCSEWDNPDWLYCRDGKYRAIEPSISPLVAGLPKGMVYSRDSSAPTNPNETQEARVMRLKGYGNAIVPQVAAEFISAFMELQD